MMETFRATDGKLYAIRIWRLVYYVDFGNQESLRYGGIVTRIGLAHYWKWNISIVRS